MSNPKKVPYPWVQSLDLLVAAGEQEDIRPFFANFNQKGMPKSSWRVKSGQSRPKQ